MITLVSIDLATGELRRYTRGVANPMDRRPHLVGRARITPWEELPPEERELPAADIERFRVHGDEDVAPVPDAAA